MCTRLPTEIARFRCIPCISRVVDRKGRFSTSGPYNFVMSGGFVSKNCDVITSIISKDREREFIRHETIDTQIQTMAGCLKGTAVIAGHL